MKKLMVAVALVAAGCQWFDNGETRIYVSPAGDDANAGTCLSPFRTLERAQIAAREAVREAKDARRVRVVLGDGTYGRCTPLRFTAEDSLVTWSADNRTKAVISGAVDLDWRKPKAEEIPALIPSASRANLIVADVPGTNAIPGFFAGFAQQPDASLVFYQDGVRMSPARDPNADDKTPMVRLERACGTPRFDPDDPDGKRGLPLFYDDGLFSMPAKDQPYLEKWAKEPDLWAFGYWRLHWAELQCKVLKVLPKELKMQVDVKKSSYGIDPDGKGDQRFYVLNTYSGLDRPGEYVVDRKNRRVWALPLADAKEPPRYAMGPTLVTAEGVRDLAFEGRRQALVAAEQRVGQTVEGARNVRDVGGWNGLRVGRAFRGSELEGKHGLAITEKGRERLAKRIGIRTDLDLRGAARLREPLEPARLLPLLGRSGPDGDAGVSTGGHPRRFFEVGFDDSKWDVVKVPCSWQALGIRKRGGGTGSGDKTSAEATIPADSVETIEFAMKLGK